MTEHTSQFYGRTWIFWVGCFVLPPISILFLNFALREMERMRNIQMLDNSIFILFFWVLIACVLWFASVFQVVARQRPVLKFYQEGIQIRSIGIPSRFSLLETLPIWGCLMALAGPIVLFIWFLQLFAYLLVLFFRCITLQTFRIRLVWLRWENLEMEYETEKTFTLFGWYEKHRKDYFWWMQKDMTQEADMRFYSVSYQTDSFGKSINEVRTTIEWYINHPESCKTLPSWEDEERVNGRV